MGRKVNGGGSLNLINSITIPAKVTETIKTFINDFEASDKRQDMRYGEDYYRSENTEIMSRQMLIYAETDDGVPYEMEDPYKANNKLPAGYFKILVDQKVNYLLGKDITFESEQAEELRDLLGRRFQTTLTQVAREASKKTVGWLHPYIDAEGNFKYSHIPSEQVIAVYSPHDHEKLELAIRYYTVKVISEDNEALTVNRVEVWDTEQVTYYQENTRTGLYDLLDEESMYNIFCRPYPNPKYHFQKDIRYGDAVAKTEGIAWGMVPFVPLYNNDEETCDLKPIKDYIDAYDIVNSDFVNNLEDFQDVYWILKGYDGTNLSEFLNQVKRYKTLKVSDDGDARSEQLEVPYLARKEAKQSLEQDIFTFGMGVNPNQVGDGSITNVVIKSRYANLDLKASQFEREVKDFIFTLMEFINRYQELYNNPPIELEDIVCNRSMIMNEIELLEANAKQKGSISESTRLSNHPWVSAVEEEQEAMRQEMEMIDLDEVGEVDEPTE